MNKTKQENTENTQVCYIHATAPFITWWLWL